MFSVTQCLWIGHLELLCFKITAGEQIREFIPWLLHEYCLSWVKICPKGIYSLTFPGCITCTSRIAAKEFRIITFRIALHLILEFVIQDKVSVGGISLGSQCHSCWSSFSAGVIDTLSEPGPHSGKTCNV